MMSVPLSKIIELINTQNYAKAELELKNIYPNNQESYDVNKLLGMTLLAQGKYRPAVKCFEKCINIKDDDYDINNNLSYIFTKIQFYDEAIKYAEKAKSLDKSKPHSYQNLAHCYFYLGQYQKAEINCRLSIDARGGELSAEFLNTQDLLGLYTDILIAQGKEKEFIDLAKKILKLYFSSTLLIKLNRINSNLIEQEYLEKTDENLERLSKLTNLVDRNRSISNVYFFLAEYYGKTDKEKSENFYIKGNQLISDMQRDSIYHRQKATLNIWNFFNGNRDFDFGEAIPSNKGEGLIFVFGMPRSGTTLTESILSTAKNIQPGGEKVFFSLQLNSIIKDLPKSSEKLNAEFFLDLGDRYLESIKQHRQNKKFFIDKLPENYLFYKFIKLALPGSKFIHCFRDPWDNAISLFKQNYSVNLFYASSFFGIATEYANYEKLISLWKEIDGENSILEIEYEKIVNDKEYYIQKIWEFCQLEGEYSEEKRKKHVGITASMQQVTKEIYQTSVKKVDFIEYQEKFYENLESQRFYWKNKSKLN